MMSKKNKDEYVRGGDLIGFPRNPIGRHGHKYSAHL